MTTSGARRRQAYWDNLMKKDDPKGFKWISQKKKNNDKAGSDTDTATAQQKAALKLQAVQRGLQ